MSVDADKQEAPPRRAWLLGVAGTVVAAGVGVALLRSRGPAPQAVVAGTGVPQLLEFGAATCDSCKKTQAMLSHLGPKFEGKVQVRYIDVNDERNAALVREYGIRLIPVLVMVDRGGNETWRFVGLAPEAVINEQLNVAAAGG